MSKSKKRPVIQKTSESTEAIYRKAKEFAERQQSLYPNMSPVIQNYLEVFGRAIEISKLWEAAPLKVKKEAPVKIASFFQNAKEVVELWEEEEAYLIKEAENHE